LGRNVVPKRKWRRNYVDLVKGIWLGLHLNATFLSRRITVPTRKRSTQIPQIMNGTRLRPPPLSSFSIRSPFLDQNTFVPTISLPMPLLIYGFMNLSIFFCY
jgi:hypothetical protein